MRPILSFVGLPMRRWPNHSSIGVRGPDSAVLIQSFLTEPRQGVDSGIYRRPYAASGVVLLQTYTAPGIGARETQRPDNDERGGQL